ncbi:unnamed protein product [Porites evermanni]|uniref:Uncharacterized protein n=1 Tax=Porites evermanni TaxID=104178 RepID=A0ABN8MID0_9CNID|nr:unnamed protein product [Porites evermanni]
MSQLHNEGLRKQLVADKRTATADWSWLVILFLQKAANSADRHNSSSGSRSAHGAFPHSTHSASYAVGSSHRSGLRSKEVVITDPYLDALTKDTKARTRKRFSSTDYLMQW